MRLLLTQPFGGCGQLAEARIRMSKTDKTRTARVQERDALAMSPEHGRNCLGRGMCDLPHDPWSRDNVAAYCTWVPVADPVVPWWKAYSDTAHRQHARRDWFRADRAAQLAILRALTREANSDGDVDENRLDNRETHRGAQYGGDYWD